MAQIQPRRQDVVRFQLQQGKAAIRGHTQRPLEYPFVIHQFRVVHDKRSPNSVFIRLQIPEKNIEICSACMTKFERLYAISVDSNVDLRSVLFDRQSTTVQQCHNSKVSKPDICYADVKQYK